MTFRQSCQFWLVGIIAFFIYEILKTTLGGMAVYMFMTAVQAAAV